jgi:hypothetical protein
MNLVTVISARFAEFRLRSLALAALTLLAATGITACAEEEEDTNSTGFAELVCEPATDDHSTCNGNTVAFCHAEENHFDPGANCDTDGLTCVRLSAAEAGCVDTAASCTSADIMCDSAENTAYNCNDGRLVVERCGSAALCEMHDGEAHCEGGDDHDHDHEGSGEDHDHEGSGEDHDHEGSGDDHADEGSAAEGSGAGA